MRIQRILDAPKVGVVFTLVIPEEHGEITVTDKFRVLWSLASISGTVTITDALIVAMTDQKSALESFGLFRGSYSLE